MSGCLDIVEAVLKKHFALRPADTAHYPEIVSYEALAHLAVTSKNEKYIKWAKDIFKPFVEGKCTQRMGAYKLYNIGGSGAAQMLQAGLMPEIADVIDGCATELVDFGPRSKEGMLTSQLYGQDSERSWIDMVFAVCPFLMFAGMALKKQRFIDEAVEQIRIMHSIFWNQKTGLYHQAYNLLGPGQLSDDHWSRGNGWGILAMAELSAYLPAGTQRDYIDGLLLQHISSCLKCQDVNGMWHQEMTDESSYVETSGTGLILYAIGVALQRGIAEKAWRDNFVAGLKGYLTYITLDYSVHNCCTGCLSPEDGSKDAYKRNPWILNDPHAFGPIALAFGKAVELGITEVCI